MTKNLLALLLALQKATLDADQHFLLAQLGNKLEAISKKHPHEQDWQNVQTKINDLLDRNPTLAGHYQQFSAQLQTWTDEDLREFSPNPDLLEPFRPKGVATLGSPPLPLRRSKDELVNEFLYVVIQHENSEEETSKKPLAVLKEFLVTTYHEVLNKHSRQI